MTVTALDDVARAIPEQPTFWPGLSLVAFSVAVVFDDGFSWRFWFCAIPAVFMFGRAVVAGRRAALAEIEQRMRK